MGEPTSYVGVWMNIIVKGFMFSPWYILKFVFTCRAKYICVPFKKHCSMNGKHLKHRAYVPYGILELLAFIITCMAYYDINKVANIHVPLFYANASDFLNPSDEARAANPATCTGTNPSNCLLAPVRATKHMPSYVGGRDNGIARWIAGHKYQQNTLYMGIERDLLVSRQGNCKKTLGAKKTYLGQKIWDAEYFKELHAAGYLNRWTREGVSNLTEATSTTQACNFLTLSLKCWCIGILPRDQSFHNACPTGVSPNMFHFLDKEKMEAGNVYESATYGASYNSKDQTGSMCAPIIKPKVWIDLSNLQEYFQLKRKWFAFTGMVISGARLAGMMGTIVGKFYPTDICQNELRKPGSQWINGWWAAIALFVSRVMTNSVYNTATTEQRHQEQLIADPDAHLNKLRYINYYVRYFPADFLVFGYRKHKKWGKWFPMDHLNKPLLENTLSLLLWAIILNISCSFFSEEAYCNDCTGFAYTMQNIRRIRRRDARLEKEQQRQRKSRMANAM